MHSKAVDIQMVHNDDQDDGEDDDDHDDGEYDHDDGEDICTVWPYIFKWLIEWGCKAIFSTFLLFIRFLILY